MKRLIIHYKKTLIFISVFFCLISFLLIYAFYPIIKYKDNIEKLPWRILIEDRYWKIITNKSRKNWYYKRFFLVNKNNKFINALIKIEDKNFYNNYWINIVSKFRAVKDNLLWKKISGASTITEQFIKNKYFSLKKRTYLQKIRESILSLYFTNKYSKKEILENYLNNIYFWNNIYWISGAIEIYFEKESLDDLNEEEIVLLLSLVNYPSVEYTWEISFLLYFDKIKKKLNYVFKNKQIYLKKYNKKNINLFPFVTKRVLEEVCDGKKEKFTILSITKKNDIKCNREIIIKSTIDKSLQEYWKVELNNSLNSLLWKNVTNGAIFAVKPKTKEILIYQWSRNFNSKVIDWEVDIIQSKRQMWSTVKPFLYLMALQKWYNPDDLLIDLVTEYNSFQKWKKYITENYSLKEYWLIRFKKALWNSMNNATVRLSSDLWLEKVYNFYKSFWFEFDFDATHYWYSLVLGNAEMKLEKLVENYSNLLWIEKNKFLLKEILKNPDNRDINFWVNSILNTSISQAVKTGTSSDFRDNTIVSYSNDMILWIWIGNNDNSSMIWITGISWAWTVWHNIIEKAIELWYIKKNINLDVDSIEWIEEWVYCLDINCFRKKIIYKKNWKEYFSRVLGNYFSVKDIKENISIFENDKLKKMWIILK